MPAARRPLAAPLLLALLCAPAPAAHAQGWAQRLGSAAKRAAAEAATRKVEDTARRGTERGIDGAAAAAAGVAAGAVGAGRAPAAPAAAPAGAAEPAPNGGPAAAPAAAALGAAWANYDFVPGARPLYVDDFAADAVGDFPRRLTWEQGTFEVVDWNGGRWLRATSFGAFAIPLPEALPARFTLELEMAAPSGWDQHVFFGPKARGDGQPHVLAGPRKTGVLVNGTTSGTAPARDYGTAPFPLRVQADGRHVKVYMGETRVANVPQADLGRDRVIRFGVSASAAAPVLIGQVRVMAGGKALYDALAAGGRVATQGVYFATASDVVRPESAATLKEIAAMLAAHPALTLTIEGHTDNAGDAAANQALSARRAAAVKQALVAQFGADAARLDTRGLGATKPVMPNATSEGRQANRRVELVRR